MRRALLTQALRNLQPVHAVNPVKIFCNQARLVALDGADAMPCDSQVAQRRHFLNGFLDVVFAKCGLPSTESFFHRIRAKGF